MTDLRAGVPILAGPRRPALVAIAAVGATVAWGLAVLPFESRAPRPAGLALFVLIAVVVIDRLPPHHPHARFGFGNGLTLVRAGGAVVFMALALEPGLLVGRLAWAALAGAALLLALDGIDGLVARQEGRASAFGARFDMEVDALLILALSVAAAGLGKAGPWVVVARADPLRLRARRLDRPGAGPAAAALAAAPARLRLAGRRPRPPSRPARRAASVLRPGGRGLRRPPRVVRRRRRLAGTAPTMTGDLRRWGGLARSLVIYRARPWKIARLARLYGGFVAPGDLAFDIGAHAGNRTRALLRAGARVVALEPQRMFHDFLARDLPREVTLLPLAAGAVPGTAELAVSRLHPTVSSLASGFPARMRAAPGFAGVRWDATETVEVTTLDALIAAHGLPRFIKIDVEGAEAEVLAGLGQPVDLAGLRGPRRGPRGRRRLPRPAGRPRRLRLQPRAGRGAPPSRSTAGSTPTRSARELRRRAGDGRAGDVYARRQGGGGA